MQNIKRKGKWKVILQHSVRKLGKRGDVVEVAHGFFRNYLSPQGLAVSYSEELLKNIKTTLKDAFVEKHNDEGLKIKEKINNKFICFARQASGTDILFGSVKNKEIAEEIQNKFKVDVNPKKIYFNESVKKIGSYKVFIDLSEDISAELTLIVARSLEDAQKIIEAQGQENEK